MINYGNYYNPALESSKPQLNIQFDKCDSLHRVICEKKYCLEDLVRKSEFQVVKNLEYSVSKITEDLGHSILNPYDYKSLIPELSPVEYQFLHPDMIFESFASFKIKMSIKINKLCNMPQMYINDEEARNKMAASSIPLFTLSSLDHADFIKQFQEDYDRQKYDETKLQELKKKLQDDFYFHKFSKVKDFYMYVGLNYFTRGIFIRILPESSFYELKGWFQSKYGYEGFDFDLQELLNNETPASQPNSDSRSKSDLGFEGLIGYTTYREFLSNEQNRLYLWPTKNEYFGFEEKDDLPNFRVSPNTKTYGCDFSFPLESTGFYDTGCPRI